MISSVSAQIESYSQWSQNIAQELINMANFELLPWWFDHGRGVYPDLFDFALEHLCIPATSVPSEQAFSIAGVIFNQRRASLTPNHLHQLLFLHENTAQDDLY